jgi:hypothetical protein
MARNFRDVIAQILPLIPVDTSDENDDFTELRNDLIRITSDWYKGAEIDGAPLWMGAASILEQWLEDPQPDWQEWKWQVLSIFTGVPFTAGGE